MESIMSNYYNRSNIGKTIRTEPAQINHTNSEGFTPLMVACIIGNEHYVQSLLSNGARADLQNKHGWSALMYACTNSLNNALLLLKHGCNTDLQNMHGCTALMLSVKYTIESITRLLLTFNIDVDKENNYDVTALTLALDLYEKSPEYLMLLIKFNASIEGFYDNPVITELKIKILSEELEKLQSYRDYDLRHTEIKCGGDKYDHYESTGFNWNSLMESICELNME